MKLTETKEILAKNIYEENDANIVLSFLEMVAPEKKNFRNERTFLNFVARKIQPFLKRKVRNSSNQITREFWNNRLISMDISCPINKKRNVLWCIKLIYGTCKAPNPEEG